LHRHPAETEEGKRSEDAVIIGLSKLDISGLVFWAEKKKNAQIPPAMAERKRPVS
jgi:hypothetical protein